MLVYDQIPLDRAGRLLAPHAIYWVRSLKTSIEEVWETVSTKRGLEKWWLVPPKEFELKEGGRFCHHWNNVVTRFEPKRFIDFDESAGAYRGTGGMRFELAQTGPTETAFLFLATFGPRVLASECLDGPPTKFDVQTAGPGTVWPAVAAGWHGMVDSLDRLFTSEAPSYSEQGLNEFYLAFLEDQFRLLDAVQRLPQEVPV